GEPSNVVIDTGGVSERVAVGEANPLGTSLHYNCRALVLDDLHRGTFVHTHLRSRRVDGDAQHRAGRAGRAVVGVLMDLGSNPTHGVFSDDCHLRRYQAVPLPLYVDGA